MKKYIFLAVAAAFSLVGSAQDVNIDNYSRSSLYSILLQHSSQRYVEDVREAYAQQPLSDKFYDHSLSIVALESTCGSKKYESVANISKFLEDNNVAQRLVAKWFNRNKEDGTFDINLLMDRGYYDANAADVELASLLKRGNTTLADAGEELIGNTFVVVYDIIYIDKEENAEKARKGLSVASSILSLAAAFIPGGSIVGSALDIASDVADMAADITEMIAGFNVKINAHLFQLDWNEEIANTFYALYYIERGQSDPEKAAKWAEASSLFKMKYVGSNASNSSKTVSRGLYSPEDVIRKVVYRALNNSVAELQRDNEVFRVKVPIAAVEGGKVFASIGMKEGVRSGDVYEVLERTVDAAGKINYKKRGTVSPVNIWDNRYMAVEEGAENSELKMTEFKILSGSDFYPGLLLRQGTGSSPKKAQQTESPKKSGKQAKAAATAATAATVATVATVASVSTVASAPSELSVSTVASEPTELSVSTVASAPSNASVGRKNSSTESGKSKETEKKKDIDKSGETPAKNQGDKVNKIMLMANLGLDINVNTGATTMGEALSYGFTFAYAKRFGFYVKGRSSFYFDNAKDVSNFSEIWTLDSHSKISYLSVTGGAVLGVSQKVFFYVGAGYGQRKLMMKDMNNSYLNMTSCGMGPIAADAGMMFRFGHFAMMAGTTILPGNGVSFFPEIGLGVAF